MRPSMRDAARVERLSQVSTRRYVGAEDFLDRTLGSGQLLPDACLSIADLDLGLELDAGQRATLAREELASILYVGLVFEAVLGTGFSYSLSKLSIDEIVTEDVNYSLHQVGEETRHSRVFIHLLRQLAPVARNPLDRASVTWIRAKFVTWSIDRPYFFQVLVLGGEEIPDLVQRLVAEHDDSDRLVADVAAYHRAEEARHMSFARLSFAAERSQASVADRLAVRWLSPLLLGGLWDWLVHPGVYRLVGLPPWSTWLQVRRSPGRRALRHQATRPVLAELRRAGAFARGVPRSWRWLCAVDRRGAPLEPSDRRR